EQEGHRSAARELLTADMQDCAACCCRSRSHLVVTADTHYRLGVWLQQEKGPGDRSQHNEDHHGDQCDSQPPTGLLLAWGERGRWQRCSSWWLAIRRLDSWLVRL